MSKKNYPEQRSARAACPGSAPAQPTGDEVFRKEPSTAAASETIPSTEELQAGMEELAGNYYKKLAETTHELADEAKALYEAGSRYLSDNPIVLMGAAFAGGVLIGMLTHRNQ
jgi:ElaB/YqjD/DUF883 family membrane-anchored ribosome-binding protein